MLVELEYNFSFEILVFDRDPSFEVVHVQSLPNVSPFLAFTITWVSGQNDCLLFDSIVASVASASGPFASDHILLS